MKLFTRFVDLLTSRVTVIAILIVFALAAVPGTLMENAAYYRKFPFLAIPLLLGLSTLACTLRNFSRFSVGVILVHVGFIIIIAGFVVRSGGYVATVNIYEAGSAAAAYRWDLKRDMPLGYDLSIGAVHREYYPSAVKIGVISKGVKGDLHTLNVCDDFVAAPYRVVVERLDPVRKELSLAIFHNGACIGTVTSSHDGGYPADFPYRFRLVAFQDPHLKRTWVDIVLTAEGKKVAAGTTEVNRPFTWNHESFYHTALNRDPDGRTYVGIQVVRDPGRPVVFAGFVIAGIGVILIPLRRSLWAAPGAGTDTLQADGCLSGPTSSPIP